MLYVLCLLQRVEKAIKEKACNALLLKVAFDHFFSSSSNLVHDVELAVYLFVAIGLLRLINSSTVFTVCYLSGESNRFCN